MRRTAISILLVLLASPSLGALPQQPVETEAPQLTLAEAVLRALAENDRLLTAGDTIEQAGFSVRVARSAFTPMTGYSRNTRKTTRKNATNLIQILPIIFTPMNKDKDIKNGSQVKALVNSRFRRGEVLVDATVLRYYPAK